MIPPKTMKNEAEGAFKRVKPYIEQLEREITYLKAKYAPR
jgi:hypothetical protein